jgi:hypothetical protein
MHKRSSRDVNEMAAAVIDSLSRKTDNAAPKKNPAAVALGRLGGAKGGPARAAVLSDKRKHDIAKKAARARWDKVNER